MLRILPFLIIVLFVLMISKLMSFFETAPQLFSAAELKAESVAGTGKQDSTAPSKNKDTTPPPSDGSSKPKLESKASSAQTEAKVDGKTETKSGGVGSKDHEKKAIIVPKLYSAIEVDILESLSKRREELDIREREISVKENVLKVVEGNIEQKITSLEKLQKEIHGILAKYEEKQNQEIVTLVKIYENMKPKDAARIFDELEMPILVEVSAQMKEAKLAPILAAMNSEHAKDLTIELANRRKINLDNYQQ